MTTKAPAEVERADEKSQIKKIYAAIEELNDVIPVINDRNRLSFNLNLYMNKEIDTIANAILQANPISSSVDYPELEKMIIEKFESKEIQ